ncbi:MAG: hypothetical protein M1839_004909, partial [Geoglossum umbratile]
KNGSTGKRALTGAEASERQQTALTSARKRARVAQEARKARESQGAPITPPRIQTRAQKAAAMLAEQLEMDAAE